MRVAAGTISGICWVTMLLAGSPAPAAAAGDTFTFNWPVPGKVAVTEKVVKRGVPATTRYDVTLARAADRKRIAVRISGLQFVEIAGMDARAPAVRAKLEPALRIAAAVPTLLINSDGTFDEVTDFDRTIDELGKTLPAGQRAAIVKAMKAPQMLASMKERSADFWGVWVGMWAGGEIEPGKTVTLNQQTALPDGTAIEQPMKFTHLGPAGPPGHVRLGFEIRLDGGASSQALARSAANLAQQMAPAAGEKIGPETIEGLEVLTTGEVVTDPATLRPVSAWSERRITAKTKGGDRSEVEARQYTFTWPKP